MIFIFFDDIYRTNYYSIDTKTTTIQGNGEASSYITQGRVRGTHQYLGSKSRESDAYIAQKEYEAKQQAFQKAWNRGCRDSDCKVTVDDYKKAKPQKTYTVSVTKWEKDCELGWFSCPFGDLYTPSKSKKVTVNSREAYDILLQIERQKNDYYGGFSDRAIRRGEVTTTILENTPITDTMMKFGSAVNGEHPTRGKLSDSERAIMIGESFLETGATVTGLKGGQYFVKGGMQLADKSEKVVKVEKTVKKLIYLKK